MKSFLIHKTPIAGLKLLTRTRLEDDRGFLSRLFCCKEMDMVGWQEGVAQITHTGTKNIGVVRGLHFQYPPWAEMKFVTCLRGRVWDVVVDIRAHSPTIFQWYAQELSQENNYSLLIPKGCAHGFQTLVDDCEMLYLHSAPHVVVSEGGLNAIDPKINIPWPRLISQRSQRDQHHPMLTDDFSGVSA